MKNKEFMNEQPSFFDALGCLYKNLYRFKIYGKRLSHLVQPMNYGKSFDSMQECLLLLYLNFFTALTSKRSYIWRICIGSLYEILCRFILFRSFFAKTDFQQVFLKKMFFETIFLKWGPNPERRLEGCKINVLLNTLLWTQ